MRQCERNNGGVHASTGLLSGSTHREESEKGNFVLDNITAVNFALAATIVAVLTGLADIAGHGGETVMARSGSGGCAIGVWVFLSTSTERPSPSTLSLQQKWGKTSVVGHDTHNHVADSR